MRYKTLLLSKDDVKECLDMPTCINIVEEVYREHGQGGVSMPPKLHLEIPAHHGWVNAMPAYLEKWDATGLKWVGGWEGNRSRNLPYIIAEIFLIDSETGLLNAVIEGGYITELRTGAATGVATKYLAKNDPHVLAIIGAGAQGRMQLRALNALFDLEDVRISDISPSASREFAKTMEDELGVTVTIAPSPREAIAGADVIVTATNAEAPLIKRAWIEKGVFIASLGSHPELDPEIVLHADKIIVDSWQQAKNRGELTGLVKKGLITRKDIYGEIGEIVAGKKPGRETPGEIIVACLIGLGSLDVGCATYAYNEAKKREISRAFDFHQGD